MVPLSYDVTVFRELVSSIFRPKTRHQTGTVSLSAQRILNGTSLVFVPPWTVPAVSPVSTQSNHIKMGLVSHFWGWQFESTLKRKEQFYCQCSWLYADHTHFVLLLTYLGLNFKTIPQAVDSLFCSSLSLKPSELLSVPSNWLPPSWAWEGQHSALLTFNFWRTYM